MSEPKGCLLCTFTGIPPSTVWRCTRTVHLPHDINIKVHLCSHHQFAPNAQIVEAFCSMARDAKEGA